MMESQFIFTTPFNARIEKKGDVEEVHMDGFISTTDQDLVDDIVTKNCLESMKDQILDRNLKLDVEHEAFRGDTPEEKELNKTKIPAGRMYDAVVEKIGEARYGLRVKSMLNNFNKDFKNIKGNVMTKMLDAYSIAFIPTKTSERIIKGKLVRFLEDVILLNVGMTGNAINTGAKNRNIFMKAINSLEDYKKEKKSNPDIGNKLEVKADHGMHKCPKCGHKFEKKAERGKPIDDEDEGTEESEADKKKKKKKKEQSKNHNHISDNQLNQGGKIMENSHKDEEANEEASEDSNDNDEGSSTESTGTETDASKESKEDESNDDSDDEKEEVKSLKKKVESLEKTVKKFESYMKKPMHKSMSESRPRDVDASKSVGPLDEFKN